MCSCGNAQLNPNPKYRAFVMVLPPFDMLLDFSGNVSVVLLFVKDVKNT